MPARDDGGRRRHGAGDVVRAAVVLRAKQAGPSLDVVRTPVAGPGGAVGRADVLRDRAGELRARIAAAQTSLALVECALGCGHEDVAGCPHVTRLLGMAAPVSAQ
ncbi:hypothetical protein ABZ464_13280 [Streptomyces sp. NPDC005820]|uniref:helix-turn-helix domain-containing protein n=1 Tax=Streptomyces sp. NPDC005820 TaxID=3157069 RepID=UPI0033D8D165